MNALENGPEERASQSAGDADAVEAGRKIILLVEDNESDRHVYGTLLWYNGYSVLHASDGATALRRASEASPDLILLDLMLPGDLDGIDVAERLRGEGSTTPIIVLSAMARQDVSERLDAAGIAAYLEKPVDPYVVVRAVMREVGGPQRT